MVWKHKWNSEVMSDKEDVPDETAKAIHMQFMKCG